MEREAPVRVNDTSDGEPVFLHPTRGFDPHPIFCCGCGEFLESETIGHVLEWAAPDGRIFHANVGLGENTAKVLGYDPDECTYRDLAEGEAVVSIEFCRTCSHKAVLMELSERMNGEGK